MLSYQYGLILHKGTGTTLLQIQKWCSPLGRLPGESLPIAFVPLIPPPHPHPPFNPGKKCYISAFARETNERKILLPGLKSPNAFSGCDFPSEQFLTEWADKITPQTIGLKDRAIIIIKHHSHNCFISGISWIFILLNNKGQRSLTYFKYTWKNSAYTSLQ